MLGVSLSEPGLWAAWNIAGQGHAGVAASIVLAATTPSPSCSGGSIACTCPRVVTAIAGFMVRYLGIVIAGEARRMHIARQSRGYDPRWLWQARGVAASAGTLFVRSYERGERVHLAMLARGASTGTMPACPPRRGGRAPPRPTAVARSPRRRWRRRGRRRRSAGAGAAA